MPIRRCKAQLESFYGFHRKVALLEVRHSCLSHLRPCEAIVEIRACKLRDLHHFLHHGCLLPFFRRDLLRRHIDMGVVSYSLHGLHESDPFHLLQEMEDVPALVTAKAIIKSFFRRH